MEELKKQFPTGLDYKITLDTSLFTLNSIDKVVHTFFEAVVLVILVVYLFLQSLRATIIPILAVPVSIVGTFIGMHLLGFSINMLTMFGLILAIGLVVDDAIVVVENVETNMTKHGLGALEAAKRAMSEIAGALISIVLVLVAVFLPVAFLGGVTGTLYQQFAITIAISVIISGVMALTLSPALAAIIIKAHHGEKKGFFRWFENGFQRLTSGYVGGVARLIQGWPVALLIFAAMLAGIVMMFRILPGSFVPDEDQGYFFIVVETPDTASQSYVAALTEKVEKILATEPAVAGRGDGERLQPDRRYVPQQRRHLLPVDEAVRGAHRPVAAHLQRAAAPERAVRAAQGGVRLRHQPAVDPGPRHDRRLRVLHPEPRRGRHAGDEPGGAGLPRGRAPAARARRRQHDLPRGDAAALRRPRPQPGRSARRAGAGRIPDDAELLRLVDRRPVQPVQPRVVGRNPGRRELSRQSRRTSARCTSARRPARWCRCRR